MCDITDARMKAIQGYLKEILEEIKATNGYLRAMCGAEHADVKGYALMKAFEESIREYLAKKELEEPKRL